MSDQRRTPGGLSVKTLLIAAAASAVAAIVIPLLWRPGTVFAAAMTPIVVALVSEALRRPVDTVSAVRVRRTGRGTAILDPPRERPDAPFDPLAPPPAEDLAALARGAEAPRAVHRRPLTGRQWKLGLVTGLVAFAAAAAVVTASELVAGDSVTSRGDRTTFFGGRDRDERRAQPTPTATPAAEETAPEETPTPTATPTPTETPVGTATPGPEATATVEPAPTGEAAPAP